MSCVGKSPERETYYEILSVKEDACYNEIKAGYKVSLLRSHPDKLLNSRDAEPNDGFLNVQKAWEVLGNPQSRAIYDRELNSSRLELASTIEVTPDEMSIQNSSGSLELAYPCRCGDFFSIGSDELHEMGFSMDESQGLQWQQGSTVECMSVVIPCFSCSLKIHLVLGSGTS